MFPLQTLSNRTEKPTPNFFSLQNLDDLVMLKELKSTSEPLVDHRFQDTFTF